MYKRSVFVLCAYLFFINSTITIVTSFLPVYFQFKGFSGEQIGWLLAIGPFAAILVQPLAGYFSDRLKTVKKIIIFCLVFLTLSSFLMFQIDMFLLLMMVSYMFFFFLSPLGPLGDSLAQKTSVALNIPFGSMRMWGSVGFASASLVTGSILSMIGINNILYPFLLFSISCLIISFFLADVTLSNKPVKIFDAVTLLKDKKMVYFLVIILLYAIPHRMNDFFIGLYINELGGNEIYIGWAWFIGATVEAFVFFKSNWWATRFHELTLLIFIGFIYTIRFIVLSFVNDPLMLLLLQPLHGITFAIAYTAALQYVSKIVPDYLVGTGHLLLANVFFSVSGIIGSLIGGFVIEQFGGNILYLGMGIVIFIGSLLMVPYRNAFNIKKSKAA